MRQNYKKVMLLLSAALLFLSGTLSAAPRKMYLGYCDPEEDVNGNFTDFSSDTWTSGAIFIPASTAATLKGNEITGMRFGVTFLLNIDAAKAWIRTSLDGEDLVSKTITRESTPALVKGWNEVEFDEAWSVPDDCEGFYLGYSVHQKGPNAYGLAHDDNPCDNGLFVSLGGNEWTDCSDKGSLMVQGVVVGENLPAVNIGIASCDFPDQFFKSKGTFSGNLQIRNLGYTWASPINVSLLVDGEPVATYKIMDTLYGSSTKKYPVKFSPTFPDTGRYEVTLKIEPGGTAVDADPADNERTWGVYVMEQALERVLLIEEFSTENCTNCPGAANRLHSLMMVDEYKDRLAAVVHHSGFGTDSFTQICDRHYEWFYGDGRIFAPGFMIDRYTTGSVTPVVEQSVLESNIRKRLGVELALLLDIKAGFDKDDNTKFVVEVNGKNLANEPICDDPHITLWLTENNVPSIAQAGASAGYKHQHLTRAVNSTWGEPVEFEGDSFKYRYVFENVNPQWKKQDLVIVGAVHERKGNDPTNVVVANACFLGYDKFSTMSELTEVESVAEDTTCAESEYFSLSGVRVNATNLMPGIYVRKTGAKTEKILVK